jgi:hypothetical protein
MESLDAIDQTRENMIAAMEAITLYLSVLSGYLVVAYTIGKNLIGFRLFLVTALFIAFSSFFVLGTFGFFRVAHDIFGQWGPQDYDGRFIIYAYWISAAQILGVIGSLYFMYDTRKAGADT